MNKLLTIVGGSFFIIEAIGIIVYLLDISIDVEMLIPIISIGAVNIAFLLVLLFGAFGRE